MQKKIGIAIIGFGRMGQMLYHRLMLSNDWDVKYICDCSEVCREIARSLDSNIKVLDTPEAIFEDETVEVAALFALADSRFDYIQECVRHHKHIISEKPVGDTVEKEAGAVELVESSGLMATVNLPMRSAWYNDVIKDFIDSGEIGELAIVRVCHLTPGLPPGEGHHHEGPAFHDCGMHYVDLARWYAGCEFKTWHAQGIRMWSYPEPWYLQCHGTFENGVVFDITQGDVYGQLSKDQTHNSYIDIIGTKGIARMSHDFKTAVVELHGVTRTERIEKEFGGKNFDVLCSRFARSVRTGVIHPQLPTFRDAATASQYSWLFLEDARKNALPAIGNLQELDQIIERRKTMKNGYGLIKKYHRLEK